MTFSLPFRQLHRYEASPAGIIVPVVLSTGRESLALAAHLDTGASFCIFRREHGEALGLPIERGLRQRVRTATGTFETFGHLIALSVLSMHWECVVYFAAGPQLARAVLGRSGFLDRVRLALIHYDRSLYLSAYDDLG